MSDFDEFSVTVCHEGHVHVSTRTCTLHFSVAQFISFAKTAESVARRLECRVQPMRIIEGGKSKTTVD